jgi:hypothetical protein
VTSIDATFSVSVAFAENVMGTAGWLALLMIVIDPTVPGAVAVRVELARIGLRTGMEFGPVDETVMLAVLMTSVPAALEPAVLR